MACLGGFISGRECAKRMVERERGTIIFTGATASMRGASGFSAFAGAKHALRALAQSMARELGPKGIHVCHVVIDGAVDTVTMNAHPPHARTQTRRCRPRCGYGAPKYVLAAARNTYCQGKM